MRQVVIIDGREMECCNRVIEAGDEIGMGVEQGTVEIEYDKGDFTRNQPLEKKRKASLRS